MRDPATQDITGSDAENTRQRRVAACFNAWGETSKAYEPGDADTCAICGLGHPTDKHAAAPDEPTDVPAPKMRKAEGDRPDSKSDYAYAPGDNKSEWKFPIHDAAHVRNALARFNQADLPAGVKAEVHAKIMAAAKKFGIDSGEDTKKVFEIAKSEPRRVFEVIRKDDDQGLVFGWQSVAVTNDGAPLEDLQGDVIDSEDLEKAAYNFVLAGGKADEMHDGWVRGHLVESVMITPQKLEAMGLTNKSAPVSGWWAGFKFDKESIAKVDEGDLMMFSIEGRAERVEV